MTTAVRRPILCVDDDPDYRAACGELLEAEGYQVIGAEDGRQALDLLIGCDALDPALILLDLNMPRMTGWELIELLRNYARLRSIPIIIVSARPASDGAPQNHHAAAYLRKPVELTTLLGFVKRHAAA